MVKYYKIKLNNIDIINFNFQHFPSEHVVEHSPFSKNYELKEQLVHSFELGPLHSVHDASHAKHFLRTIF